MNIPIFCINLERAEERRKRIIKDWKNNLGLNINFWKAYDKLDIEANRYVYPYDKNLALSEISRELNYGEIACVTSFCMFYEYCIKNNFEEVIVMEDDAVPMNHACKIFEYIDQGKFEFPDAEIFILFKPEVSWEKRFKKEEIFYEEKSNFSLCKNAPWGNQLIYLRRKSIIILYEILKNMTMPADRPHQKILCDKKMVAIINNPIAKHDWIGHSYIGNEHRKTKRK